MTTDNWLKKIADIDQLRIENNIKRLESLGSVLHKLSDFVIASPTNGYKKIKELLDDNLVRDRKHIKEKLLNAFVGENNQKIALDSPTKCHYYILEAEEAVKREIIREKRLLADLSD